MDKKNLSEKREKLKKSFIEISKYPKEVLDHVFEALYYQDKEFISDLKEDFRKRNHYMQDINEIINKRAGEELANHSPLHMDKSDKAQMVGIDAPTSDTSQICECGHYSHSDGNWDGTTSCLEVVCPCKKFTPQSIDILNKVYSRDTKKGCGKEFGSSFSEVAICGYIYCGVRVLCPECSKKGEDK